MFHSTVSNSKKSILLSVALFTCFPFHTFLISHCSTVPVFHCQLLAVLSHCARSRSISLFTISWPVYHPLSGKSVAGRALASALFFKDSRTRRQLASFFFSLLCGAFIRKELAKQNEAERRKRQKLSKQTTRDHKYNGTCIC